MRIPENFSKDLVEFSLSRGRAILDGHRLFSHSQAGDCAEFAYPEVKGELSCGHAFKLMQAAMLSASGRQSTDSFLSSLDLAMATQSAI